MTKYISVEELTADRVTTAELVDYEIPGLGMIQLRPLSRAETIEAQKFKDDVLQAERFTLSRAIVSPEVKEHHVAAWQRGSFPLEINAVADKINEISGLKKGADKSSVDEAGDRSRPGV